MINGQRNKVLNLVPPAILVDNASLAITELDTLGWDYCEIYLILGETDIAMSAVTLTEGDTSGSGHANITASIWGTADNHVGTTSTLPSATDDDGIFKYELDLTQRLRYIDGTFTVGDGTAGGYYAVIAVLSRGKESPSTAAQAGCSEIIRI